MILHSTKRRIRRGLPGRYRASPALAVATAALVVVGAAACSNEDAGDDNPLPVVDQIGEALDAIEARYDTAPTYFEVSANLVDVRAVVAENIDGENIDGASANANGYAYANGELQGPELLGQADGSTFAAAAIAINPDTIFDGIIAGLGDVLITDLAIVGGPDGVVVYDATVRSDKGGQLRVRVDGDGRVLEVMAE